MLENLDSLFVHYCTCPDVALVESSLLRAFADGMSTATRGSLYDPGRPMPYANLKNHLGNKALAIKGARAPRSIRAGAPGRVVDPRRPTPPKHVATIESASAHPVELRTQRVTAADIQKVRSGFHAELKDAFPDVPSDVEVMIRGTAKTCRWNPRNGPDQGRSGVLGIGRAVMADLIVEGEVLNISREGGVIHVD